MVSCPDGRIAGQRLRRSRTGRRGRAMNELTSGMHLQQVQRLATSGARTVAPFVAASRLFMAVPQPAEDLPEQTADMNGGNSDIDTIIYEWRSDRFTEHQRLPSHGAEDAEFFRIGARPFLAIACIRAGRGPYLMNTQSVLYEWREDQFVAFQHFASFAAKQWRHFTVGGRHFLALAQGVAIGGAPEPQDTHSTIFEWTGSRFEAFQAVQSSWAYNWEFFTLVGVPYLALADHSRSSTVHRSNGKSFEPFQSFGNGGGRAFAFFEADGDAYLAFADLERDSELYRWNGHRFVAHQSLEGPGGHAFAFIAGLRGRYLIRINYVTGSRAAPTTALCSQIYRCEHGRLVTIEQFPTFGGTDTAPFSVGDQLFVAVSNSLSKDVRFPVTPSSIVSWADERTSLSPTVPHVGLLPPEPRGVGRGRDFGEDNMAFIHSPGFECLFKLYTADPNSVGSHLTQAAERASAANELVVASGTDIAVFPGGGRPPVVESFRLNTRGFVELAAISHLGSAVAALIRMRELDPAGSPWRTDAQRLIDQLRVVRAANAEELWRDQIAVAAWAGRISKIIALVDYACTVTSNYLQAALADESWLTFERLRAGYLEATEPGSPPIPFNHVMIATFCLTALDISHRMIQWLRGRALDWERLMVLITGQSGRATAGLSWSSNNMCYLLSRASEGRLAPERLYIVPHAPDLASSSGDGDGWLRLEQQYRTLWFNTHVNVELAGRMFDGYPRYRFALPWGQVVDRATEAVNELPAVASAHDMFALVSRLRFVLEDPRQLISNCVADVMIDQLFTHDSRPEKVEIPDFPTWPIPQNLCRNVERLLPPIVGGTGVVLSMDGATGKQGWRLVTSRSTTDESIMTTSAMALGRSSGFMACLSMATLGAPRSIISRRAIAMWLSTCAGTGARRSFPLAWRASPTFM